jgi:hypothetical protein
MEMWCLGFKWSRNSYVPATEEWDYYVLKVLEEAQAEVSIVRTSDWAEFLGSGWLSVLQSFSMED